MRRLLCIALFTMPVLVMGQAETVVQPRFDLDYDISENHDDFNIRNDLVVNQEPELSSEKSEDFIAITTELGTTTIPTGPANFIPPEPSVDLDNIVQGINRDYAEAETECTTGSWLANIWCRITGLFSR